MKTILPLVAFFLCASISWAETEISREEAGKIKTYALPDLNASMAEVEEGKVIKIKFTYRGEVEKQADGSLKGVIRYLGRNYSESGFMQARVPQEGAAWFMKLPYGSTSRQTLLVFARIHKDEATGTYAELLGREMRTDAKGSKIIW